MCLFTRDTIHSQETRVPILIISSPNSVELSPTFQPGTLLKRNPIWVVWEYQLIT